MRKKRIERATSRTAEMTCVSHAASSLETKVHRAGARYQLRDFVITQRKDKMKMLIKANGIEIHCELTGKPGAPAVVLSHSLASGMVMWEPQHDVLEDNFRVLQYDMRGHGSSEVVKGAYTLELLGNDVIGLMDALGIESAHFIGLSIGGMIGQCFALNYADRLKSLTLCDTSAIMPDEAKPILQGRIAAAMRTILGAAGMKLRKRFVLEILE